MKQSHVAASIAVFLAALSSGASTADAEPSLSVFHPPRQLDDSRLREPRTLNGYHPWRPITNPELWQARAREVRQRILVSAGLWPRPKPVPLNPVIHGRREFDAYTVEKVFFTSYPGFYVTGNLYRPVGKEGPLPAVLSAHGHWPEGRFYRAPDEKVTRNLENGGETTQTGARYPLQARCAMLARMGCVVFHYDMVGYADSKQIRHREGFLDAEAELRLQSFFGLQTYNTIRAFDFLSSLPDVDPGRIGMTGGSGGGTQTFILNAIDPRPAASFPAVMISTGMQGGCPCENASHLRVGSSNIEFAAMCVPRPLGMTGADDWTIDIETTGLPELKEIYRSYGVEGRVMARSFPQFKHNYNQVSRELMYEWMNSHLGLRLESPIKEHPLRPIPPEELSVFDEQHPRPAEAVDSASLRRYLTQHSDEQMTALHPNTAFGLSRFRTIVGTALKVMLATGLPEGWQTQSQTVSRETTDTFGTEATVERVIVGRHGNGEEVPVIRLRPVNWRGKVVIAIHPEGKSAMVTASRSQIEQLLGHGVLLVLPDVFWTGESVGESTRTVIPHPLDKRYAGFSYGYNRTLIANRVHDILTVISHAKTLSRHTSVRLLGVGEAGVWVALARALAGTAVTRTALEDTGFRFKDVDSLDHVAMLPGAVKYGDVPAFLALCAPARLTILSEIGGREPLVDAAYASAGAHTALRVVSPKETSPEEIASWLAAD